MTRERRAGLYEDPDGLASPERLKPVIAKWLRPGELAAAQKAPEMPVYMARPPSRGDPAQEGAEALNRNVAGVLKLGHQEWYWLAAALSTIETWSVGSI